MFLLRCVCALVVVSLCFGDPALHPESLQGPRSDLHSNHHFDLYNTQRYDIFRNPQNHLINDGFHHATPFGYHDDRHSPFVPQRSPVIPPPHHAPTVTTFNAPAGASFRGSIGAPNPQVHNTHPYHTPLNTVHKTPVQYARPVPQPKPVIPIKSQYHVQDEIGQYSFGYDAGISTRQETRDAYGNVRGSFSYIDSNGELQTQHYVAGKGGFQVRGTNLPVHVTNEKRHKRSYATFPASTGPLTPPHYFQDPISATPYHVYGPPRQGFSYSIQSNSPIHLPSSSYYPEFPHTRQRGYYY